MTTEHTPGPWFATPYYSHDTLVRSGNPETGRRVAITFAAQQSVKTTDGYKASIQMNEANARLIAAAPDMLDALKLANEALSNPAIFSAFPVGAARVALADAISLAEGH